MTVADHSFSLIYLNPPYDYEAVKREEDGDNTSTRKNHVEYNFLRETMQKLQPDGLLIFVLQHKILGTDTSRAPSPPTSTTSVSIRCPTANTRSTSSACCLPTTIDSVVDDDAGAKELMKWKTTPAAAPRRLQQR